MDTHKKIGILFGFMLTVFVTALFVASNVMQPVVENQIYEPMRKTVLVPLGDGNPGDNTGLFYFMIYPHQADPGTAYASNLSNATAYEFSDYGNQSCTGETPYAPTTFDIVLKIGITDEDGKNTSGWQDSFNWCHITCADLSIGADTNMSEQVIGTGGTYAWYHYYMNNGGSGYTIEENEDFNVTSVKLYVRRIVS